jgi:hypothetical protein
MTVAWSDDVDEILGGDLVAALGYLTPAKGVVIAPIAPLGLRDRDRGTVTVTTSLALWKKLDRIRRNPGVAMAYHTRELGQTNRPGFVLVQGQATVQEEPNREWLKSIEPNHARDLGPRKTGLVGRLLHTYYWERVAIEIAVDRVVAYPDTEATEEPLVFGTPLAPAPAPQKPPAKGSGPRVDVEQTAKYLRRLPHRLLGWCGSDGMPEVVPIELREATSEGLELKIPTGSVPAGGRRAGLTAHDFEERMQAQHQRVYTGWISSDGAGRAIYAPHTKAGHRLPSGELAYTLACMTLPSRMRAARKAGVAN